MKSILSAFFAIALSGMAFNSLAATEYVAKVMSFQCQ